MIGDEAAAARWKGRAEAHKDRLEAAFWLEKEGHYRDTLERPLFLDRREFGRHRLGIFFR